MSPPQTGAGDEAGNAAGDRWDTTAAGTDTKSMEESFEMVPRAQDEVDVPNPAALPADTLQERSGNSWADETPAYDDPPKGFVPGAGGADDVKAAIAAGESQTTTNWADASEPSQPLSANGWAETPSDAAEGAAVPKEEGDGFSQVPGRRGGRGGRGRGDGEFRGRGGRGRGFRGGDGEFRGRGRGGFRGRGEGGEFRGGRGGGEGEFRGRGGRGRGMRGGAEGPIHAA